MIVFMTMPSTGRLPTDAEVLAFGRDVLGQLLEAGLRGGDEYEVRWFPHVG
jgi:hypothetical protein